MKKHIISIFSLLLAFTLTGCNDWLDVQSETEEKEDDLYASYEGFRAALTGCYTSMADQDAYGERLTMSDVESLAHLWLVDNNDQNLTNINLANHDYDNDNAETAISAFYQALFNVITQANTVRKHIQTDGGNIPTEQMRNIIEGETYAIRAYCQMDILRLFGQMPQNATQQVMLPYSNTSDLTEMPPYYNFADYVSLLENDLEQAEQLLKDNDPVCEYSFDDIHTSSWTNNPATIDDDYLNNRDFRLNYWAVKALQARLALYLGETDKAYTLAKEIIDETDSDGSTKFELSGATDLASTNNYYALPSECLFKLAKSTLSDYVESNYFGGNTSQSNIGADGNYYAVSRTAFDEMFQGVNITSDNRYLSVWNKNLTNMYGSARCCIKKYWYDSDAENITTHHNIIPMLRMSEIYLIAIETAPTLSEANSLWATYLRSHNVLQSTDAFATDSDRSDMMLAEYRREFFAEGQMFYTYKRTGTSYMLWSGNVDENTYIVPLPSTEYNPN